MDLLQRLLYTSLGAAAVFYIFVRIRLSYWKRRGILHEKPKFLWGNLKGVGSKRHLATILKTLYDKFKEKAPFIGFYTYLNPMLLVTDLNLIRDILQQNADNFIDRGLYNNEIDEPLSGNLVQLDGDKWKHLHTNLKPMFAKDQLSAIMPKLLQAARTFQHSFEKEHKLCDIFIINELVQCYNIDVISALAFGVDSNSLQYANMEFRSYANSYLSNFNLLKAYLAYNLPMVARVLQFRSYNQIVSVYFEKLVRERIMDREWNRKEQEIDFLNLLIQLRRHSNSEDRLSYRKIAAQSFSFILAGLQACNSTMTFCLYELAIQPDLQTKARTEISNVLYHYKGELSLESLEEMKYLKQILYETLRKHSPYPFLLRTTTQDFEVSNSVFMLQQGNTVVIPISAIHHDPNIYPNPQQFDPDRFSPEAIRLRHPMSWLPFGAGPRGCIALHYAQTQMLVGLVTLLQSYTFSVAAETPVPLAYDNSKLIATPKADVRLQVKRI